MTRLASMTRVHSRDPIFVPKKRHLPNRQNYDKKWQAQQMRRDDSSNDIVIGAFVDEVAIRNEELHPRQAFADHAGRCECLMPKCGRRTTGITGS